MEKSMTVRMSGKMRDFVIYTIMVGGYDDVLQPLAVDDRFDYILFSNDFAETKIGVWEVRPIPIPAEIARSDNKRLSRYPKSHPESMLSEYKASLYMDANIQIADKWIYEKCIEYARRQVQLVTVHLSTIPHPFAPHARDDIYEHVYDMCSIAVDHDFSAIKQCHALYKKGFPAHYGLNENNLIFRLHTNVMRCVDEEWWWWIVNFSFRDQFSYMYCLWKNNITAEYFFPYGTTVRNTPHFSFRDHGSDIIKTKKVVKVGLLENIRIRCKNISVKKYNRYCRHWLWLMRLPYPQIALNVWTIAIGAVNAPRLFLGKVRRWLKSNIFSR